MILPLGTSIARMVGGVVRLHNESSRMVRYRHSTRTVGSARAMVRSRRVRVGQRDDVTSVDLDDPDGNEFDAVRQFTSR
jgi:hypothetical protein